MWLKCELLSEEKIVDPENNNNFVRDEKKQEGRNYNYKIPLGSSQEELRRMYEDDRPEQDFADRLGRRIKEAEGELQRPLNFIERQDVENRFALHYSKENDLWVNDFYSLGNYVLIGGNENTLIVDAENLVVYKANNLMNSQGRISKLLDMIENHNNTFPETRYEFVGFTGIDNGANCPPYIEVILRQFYIPNAIKAIQNDIDSYMDALGFEKLNDSTFSNGEYIVSDLHPRNVLKDTHGFIHVVDDIIHHCGTGNKQDG